MPDSLADRNFDPDVPATSELGRLFPGLLGDDAELQEALARLAKKPDESLPDALIFAQKAAEIGAVQVAAWRAGMRAAFGFFGLAK